MDKLEKVIKGLECCMSDGSECYEPSNGKCPYYKDDVSTSACTDDLFYDVYALLKAQEQKPISASIVDSDGGLMHWWACGNCQAPINPEDKFCHECGRAVKWE